MPRSQPKKKSQPLNKGPSQKQSIPVLYDRVEITEYSTTSEKGPITAEDVVDMLGWETEEQYQKRMVKENPSTKPEHWLFGDNGPRCKDTGQFQPIHCVDTYGRKVVCWHNANNRPFDMAWCEELIHTILHWQWVGPLTTTESVEIFQNGQNQMVTFPATINGETIRISRYGRVLSGQHQGTALKLADERLQVSRSQPGNALSSKYPAWNGHEHPVIETIVVKGLSEDERVLQSIDYVKPRSLADMLFTMPLFRNNTYKDRQELTRMLAAAANLLWDRTDTKGYKTHTEMAEFLKRHKRLLKCVEHLFVENSAKGADGGRKISKLRLNPGHAGALHYLMGSAGPKTEGDVYRNESPPSERDLDWSYWDKSQDFWTCLAGARDFMPVRMALGRLTDSTAGSDDNQGLGGRLPEKLAILAKAWEVYKDHPSSAGPAFTDEDLGPDGALCLSYTDLGPPRILNDRTIGGDKLPDGEIRLVDVADFSGIDCPESIGARARLLQAASLPEPPPPTPEDIERLTREALMRRQPAARA